MTTNQNQVKELAEYLRSIAENFEMPDKLLEAASALDSLHRIQGAELPHEIASIERQHNAQLTRLGIETSNRTGKDADADRATLLGALRAKEAEIQEMDAINKRLCRESIDDVKEAVRQRDAVRAQLAQAQQEIKLLRFGLCSGVENCGHCRIEAWKEASDCETPEEFCDKLEIALTAEVALMKELAELRETLRNVEDVSSGYKRVLDAIPECPPHGPVCVPFALEWVAKAKASIDELAKTKIIEAALQEKIEGLQTYLTGCD